ncbi:MAG: DNA mismatch repair protein MutL [Thermomicrobiales bacterium]|nr:MAG: DNA mismatch repair protein MutL [Thermomicrobiales bacterium]
MTQTGESLLDHPREPARRATARHVIRQLPAEVAARIAAGEVIERPASVVKELVENALDAGATAIRIDVRGGGLTLIRVSDNGCGIPPGELWLACQRHATSKLLSDDLTTVRTLGFRGEALPSIAAVAELTIVSADDTTSGIGRRIVLRDGRRVTDAPAARPQGTTVTVRHLFANLPARLAAVERPQTESAHIGQMVRRLALTAPHVRFTLYIEERLAVQTSGSGDLATTMVEVYSPSLTGSLIALGPVTVGSARLAGFVAGAEMTRPGRSQLNIIVNGRWTQPRGLLALLENAYRPLLPRGRHPIAALVIDVPPGRVDINVHPAKLEVRLLDERQIGQALGEMVREALGRRPIPLTSPPLTGLDALTLPVAAQEAPVPYDDRIVTPGLPPLRLIGQVQRKLLLLEGEAGLYLIDQHRAHERVLYEHLTATYGGSTPEPVPLPEPIIFEVRPSQAARLAARLDELAALGFTCEGFGGRTFLLRAAPALPGVLPGQDADDLMGIGERDALVSTLLGFADEEDVDSEGWKERLLVQLACRTAVRRGRPLGQAAMIALVQRLGQTRAPAVCPHGSPLLMHVTGEALERQFGWR